MSGNKVVVLNVGGRQFTTTTATLTSPAADDSMLARLVSLHLQQSAPEQPGVDSDVIMQPALVDATLPDGLFIDRDGTLFHYILNYLRDGGNLVAPKDLHTTQLLLQEAQFYQIQGLVAALEEQQDYLIQEENGKKEQARQTASVCQEVRDLLADMVQGEDDKQELAKQTVDLLSDIAEGLSGHSNLGGQLYTLEEQLKDSNYEHTRATELLERLPGLGYHLECLNKKLDMLTRTITSEAEAIRECFSKDSDESTF